MEKATADVDKLLQENQSLNQAMTHLTEINSQLELSLENALERINWFEEQLKLMRNHRFGNSSEKTSTIQEELIFNIDDNLATQAQETSITDVEKTEIITYKYTIKNKGYNKMVYGRI